MRIAVGGIAHETNTFSTQHTTHEHFRVQRGEIITQGEFWEAYHNQGVEWAPTLTAGASPYGLVAKSAYLTLKDELLDRLAGALPVDGIYLSLHGAMEVEEIGDGESDLVGAVRSLVGPDVLISASLDLHGNIAPQFVESADILTALRTAPHRDGLEIRQRAIGHLIRCIKEEICPVSVLIKPPLLLPGEFAVTEVEPARSLYQRLLEIEAVDGILDASLLIGCAWTDSIYTSTSVIVIAENSQMLAYEHGARLARAIWERRHEFRVDVETASVDEAIAHALQSEEHPVFLSDSGDNVTAGAPGDMPVFVERLLAAGAEDAVVGGINDPEAVDRCVSAGIGAEVTLSIGGKLDSLNASPLRVTGTVRHLGPDSTTLAVLRIAGVDVILTKGSQAFTTLGSFRRAGIDPMTRRIIVVKLGYLFPDLRDNAPRAIMALSPGFTDLRVEELPYQNVQRPIFPLDREFEWTPPSM